MPAAVFKTRDDSVTSSVAPRRNGRFLGRGPGVETPGYHQPSLRDGGKSAGMFIKPLSFKSLLSLCCGCLLISSMAGCGPKDPLLVQVEGKVTVGNKPLPRGTVSFHPDAAKGNDSKE